MIIKKMNIEWPEINYSLGDPLPPQPSSHNEGAFLLNFNGSQDDFCLPSSEEAEESFTCDKTERRGSMHRKRICSPIGMLTGGLLRLQYLF